MTWLATIAPGESPLDRVFGLCPDAYARFRELHDLLRTSGIDPLALGLCRARIAMIVGCDADLVDDALAVPDDLRAELPGWPTSPRFTEQQRACIEFAEQYVLDPRELTDEQFARLRRHWEPAELAAFTLAVAMFDADVRFRVALGVS